MMRTYSRDVTYSEAMDNEEQRRKVIRRYIREWSKRFGTKRKMGEAISQADVLAYSEEARKYFTIEDELNVTTDISKRNILSYKIRTTESKFANLMSRIIEQQLKNE